jgi:hypothetical protein
MTEKGLRKCRAADGEENQNQVSARRPQALGNRWRDSHIPAAPAVTAMGKWKSTSRIPTFPQRLNLSNESKTKGDQPRPEIFSFRLISGLEYAMLHASSLFFVIAIESPKCVR